MLLVMPRLNEGKVGFFNIYRHEWGDSLPKIAGTMLGNPAKVVRFLHSTPGATPWARRDTEQKRIFYGHVFLPVLFLSLLSPSTVLLAAPVLLQQMLSARLLEHNILRHYIALLLPVVMVSAGMGLRSLIRWLSPAKAGHHLSASLSSPGRARLLNRILAAALVLSAVLCPLAYGPFGLWSVGLRESGQGFKASPTAYHRLYRKHWDEMARQVPADVPVVSTFIFQSRLADREELYSYHHLYKGTYTLSDEPFPLPEGIQAALIDFDDALLMGSWRDFDAGARMRAFFEREQLERLQRPRFDLPTHLPKTRVQDRLRPLRLPHLAQAVLVRDLIEEPGALRIVDDHQLSATFALDVAHLVRRDPEQPGPKPAPLPIVPPFTIRRHKCHQCFLGPVLGIRLAQTQPAPERHQKRLIPLEKLVPDLGIVRLAEPVQKGCVGDRPHDSVVLGHQGGSRPSQIGPGGRVEPATPSYPQPRMRENGPSIRPDESPPVHREWDRSSRRHDPSGGRRTPAPAYERTPTPSR